MKIKISILALSLFWWVPLELDLDTGEIYNTKYDADKIANAKNTRRLPRYSRAPIYQQYLERERDRFELELEGWFDQFPKFEFIPDHVPEDAAEFFELAHPIVEDFSEIEAFAKYLGEYRIRFAKEWCEQEGYEWYEE